MKIAMIGQFPPHIGGVGTHIHNLSKELVKNGAEVFVVTYPHKAIKNSINNKNTENKNTEDNENDKNNEKIHVFSTWGPNIAGLRSLFFLIFGTMKLISIVRKYDIDIIHGHYLFPAGLVAVLGGIFTKKKVYVTSHGSDISYLYPKYKFMRPIIKFVLKHADVILVVSESLKEELLNIAIPNLDSKVKIHWNAIDIDKFKPNNDYKFKKELKRDFDIPIDKAIILYVGNLTNRKNVDILIKAKEQISTASTLVIVGDGAFFDNLKTIATDSKNKPDDIIFTGSRDDIEDIIPSADLLVLPSSNESFGLVLLEALACEKPVIGTNIGGIKEIITEEVGLLVKQNDVDDLAKAINLILSNEKLREKFKSNARKRAKNFSKMKIPY